MCFLIRFAVRDHSDCSRHNSSTRSDTDTTPAFHDPTPHGDHGANVVLAGQHLGRGVDSLGLRGPAGLDVARIVGRRPRPLLRGESAQTARGGQHYILGERLRSGSAEAAAALSRPGRYQHEAENLQVKKRSASPRTSSSWLTELITGGDRLSATKQAELRGQISTMPGLNRYLRTIPGGLLRLDAKAIPAEVAWTGSPAALLGPALSGEDIALGYKQLLEVERGWRDLKTTPHPRARAAVLAGAAPGPGRGEHHRAHLGAPARGDLAAARRGVPKAPPDASGALSSPPPSATSSPPCESTHATKIIEIAEAEPPDQAQHSAWTRVRPGGDHAFPQLTAPSPVQLTCQLRSAGQVNLLYLI